MNTKERAARSKAARAAAKTRFAEQTITIDENWRIVRADELNWEIQHKGQFYGYYGSLISAFKDLPAKMLGDGAKKSVADVLEQQRSILERIEAVLNLKLAA